MMQGNPEGSVAARRQREHARRDRSQHGGPPAADTFAIQRNRRRFRNIRLQRQFAPMLVAITLLCTLGLTGLAYLGARSYTISGAQTQALQAIQSQRQLVLPQGATLHVQEGRLLLTGSSGAATPLVLNDDTTLVDQTRSLTGDDATIYQSEGARLVAVSTNLPAADARGVPIPGSRALGDILTGAPFDALQGGCASNTPPSCHQTYQGIITVRGVSYATAIVPLYDTSGTYIGALGTATPLDSVTAPATQLAILLLIAGLLLAMLSLVLGFWFFGSLAERTLGALDLRLRHVADAAAELERLAQLQSSRAARQDRVARQVTARARTLDSMADVMEQGRATLRDASGNVWAEMSHPGTPPDPAATVRLAQQAAVAAAQVGSAAEDARDVSAQLVGLMNHIIAESAIVGDGGIEMEDRAKELRAALESVEMAVGERLLQRSLFVRRVRAASRRVRHYLPAPFSRDTSTTDPRDDVSTDLPTTTAEPHPVAHRTWTALDSGTSPSLPRKSVGGVGSPAPQHQHQQQRTPRAPRLIRTGELPSVLPHERPGGSGLLSRHSAEPSLPRSPRPPQGPPRGDQPPGESRRSGRSDWLG